MPALNRVKDRDIDFLSSIVGAENALPAECAENYYHDETPELSAKPACVLKPADEKEISEILKYANDNLLPVVPRGLGTGVAGGSIAFDNAIMLSLERLNKIIEIDLDNLMAVVQPSVITGELQNAVEERGLFYPPDPASKDSCSIGGNVATNAGGLRAVKYGVTRDYVKGIRAVLPSGERISYGGKLVKNVAGYDILHTLIGSEGTLAVITEITLKLIPLPQFRVDLLVGFENVSDTANAVTKIIQKKLIPTAIEFIEGDIVRLVAEVGGKELPMLDCGAQLIISWDSDNKEELERRYFELGEIAMEAGAIDVLVADTRPFQDRIWEARRAIRETLRAVSPTLVAEDVAVPRDRIADLWKGARELGKKYGLRVLSFGHAGDGNLHIDALKDDLPEEKWRASIEKWIPDLFELTVSLGGTITAEHGIGVIKRKYLPIGIGRAELELMCRIKKAFDPNGILNPGKAI